METQDSLQPKRMAARVLFDLSLDRSFDYLIPDVLLDKVVEGVKVNVTFGNSRKLRKAVVVAVVPAPKRDDFKEIHSVCEEAPVIPPSLLKLGSWIAEYYCCPRDVAMRCLLPAAIRSGKVKPRNESYYYISDQGRAIDYAEKVKKKSPARSEVVKKLVLQPGLAESLLLSITGASHTQLQAMVKAGFLKEEKRELARDPFRTVQIMPTKALPLTEEQTVAMDMIRDMLVNPSDESPHVMLLYGVTCSGKTEVYLQAIELALRQGGEAIVLVPEISLTPQTVTRFRGRFGEQVSVLHSGLTDGERRDEWMKVYRKQVKIAVGARSALFAPFRNLKLIIVDEEHDSSYKQGDAPRYHARDIAVLRGKMEHAAVILGSATPSLESWHNAATGKYRLATMKKRWDENIMLPSVQIVDMKLERDDDDRIPAFSKQLRDAIQIRLMKTEQTILFLNKRGYSRQLQCSACGYVPSCDECSMPYTYHKHTESMICHLCGNTIRAMAQCPQCGGTELKYIGSGTERIELQTAKLFPHAKISRMDSDTMTSANAYEKVLSEFRRGNIDILIGTQMIAKGLDFPNVTLVGVLNADMGLFTPDFRAHERTFQLLAQVAGRAGRSERGGEVIIQTYSPANPAILCAQRHSCQAFFDEELPIRKDMDLPPYFRYWLLHFEGEDEKEIESNANALIERIRQAFPEIDISDAIPSFFEKIRNKHRYCATLRYKNEPALRHMLRHELNQWKSHVRNVSFYLDVDALFLL